MSWKPIWKILSDDRKHGNNVSTVPAQLFREPGYLKDKNAILFQVFLNGYFENLGCVGKKFIPVVSKAITIWLTFRQSDMCNFNKLYQKMHDYRFADEVLTSLAVYLHKMSGETYRTIQRNMHKALTNSSTVCVYVHEWKHKALTSSYFYPLSAKIAIFNKIALLSSWESKTIHRYIKFCNCRLLKCSRWDKRFVTKGIQNQL